MIVEHNGARYRACSSVQWAKKQGLSLGVKWNRTVWGYRITDRCGRMKGKHAQNCCVYFWIGLFVFPLPSVVTKIAEPKNRWWGSGAETEKLKRWPEGFLVIRNILCPLQTILQTFPQGSAFLFFLCTAELFPSKSPCARGPAHPCCQSELWLMELKMDIKSSVPFGPSFLCKSSFKFENWTLFLLDLQSIELAKWPFSFPTKLSRGHLYMLSHCLCPASPTRPPDVQISPSHAGASLQRRATWEWLSWQGAAGLLACQSRQSGALCGSSRIEKACTMKVSARTWD